jgi:hypothetical protein
MNVLVKPEGSNYVWHLQHVCVYIQSLKHLLSFSMMLSPCSHRVGGPCTQRLSVYAVALPLAVAIPLGHVAHM